MMILMMTTKDIKIQKLQRRTARIIMQKESGGDALAHLKYDMLGLRQEIHVLKLCEEMFQS